MALSPLSRLLVCALVTSFLLAACAPTGLRGVLPGDQTWQGQILIDGDLLLPAGATLTVLPGTEVLFRNAPGDADPWQDHPHFPGAELVIRGRLVAAGTADRPIRFRHADPDAAPGSWGGINFMEGASASLSHCLFSQANSALHSQESAVSVRESIFVHNLVGLRFHSSDLVAERNLFDSNGTAVRFHFGSPRLLANRFENNDKTFFLTSYPRDYHITGNAILSSRTYHVVLGEEVPEDVDLRGNYWGSTDANEILRDVFDGRRLGYLGRVRLDPFLTEPPGAGPTWMP